MLMQWLWLGLWLAEALVMGCHGRAYVADLSVWVEQLLLEQPQYAPKVVHKVLNIPYRLTDTLCLSVGHAMTG